MPVPVEEYLSTLYRPDCDYIDGEVVERSVGERTHGHTVAVLGSYFYARRKLLGLKVFPGLRIQVKENRYRVADLCVILGNTDEEILTVPPFLCIEILSSDERMSNIQDRIDDYFAMGVPNTWVIDPWRREAFEATAAGDLRIAKEVLRTGEPVLEVPLVEIFE